MPKGKVDWGVAMERTGLTRENDGKPGTLDRIAELRRLPVVNLALDEIAPNPRQPRRSFDAKGEGNTLEKLAADIRQNGVLQPILVVERGKGQYQIVAGERRWRAASMAGLGEIPARVLSQERWPRPLDDREIMAISMAENYQRLDLSTEEAAANARQLVDLGYSQREIGRIMGRSQAYISQLLAGEKVISDLSREGDKSLITPSPVVLAEAQRIEDAATREMMIGKVARGEAGLREVRAVRKAERPADPVVDLQRACNTFVKALAPFKANPAAYADRWDDLQSILTTTEGEIGKTLDALKRATKAARHLSA